MEVPYTVTVLYQEAAIYHVDEPYEAMGVYEIHYKGITIFEIHV